jgi:hypothetical protein
MRLVLRGGLALALCLGLAWVQGRAQEPTPAPAADDQSTPGGQDPFWKAWAGKGAAYRLAQQRQAQAEKEAQDKAAKAAKIAQTNPSSTGSGSKSLVEDREKERNAYLRRLEVCNKLAEIAAQTNDTSLMHQVEQMEGRIFEVYQQRTGLNPAAAPTGEMKPEQPKSNGKATAKSADTGTILPTPPATKKASRVEDYP